MVHEHSMRPFSGLSECLFIFFRSVLALCLPSPTSTPLYRSLHTLPLLPWAGVRTGIDLHAVYGALHRNTSLLLAHASLPLCFSLYLRLSLPPLFSLALALLPPLARSLALSLFLASSRTDTPSLSDVRSFDHPVLRPPFALSRDAWKNHERREHGRKGIPNNNNSDGFGSTRKRWNRCIAYRFVIRSDRNFFLDAAFYLRARQHISVGKNVYVVAKRDNWPACWTRNAAKDFSLAIAVRVTRVSRHVNTVARAKMTGTLVTWWRFTFTLCLSVTKHAAVLVPGNRRTRRFGPTPTKREASTTRTVRK